MERGSGRSIAERDSFRDQVVTGRRLLLGDAGRVERGDLVQHPHRALDQRQRQQGTGSLAEPQLQVDERAQPEMIEGGGVAGFGGAVPGDAAGIAIKPERLFVYVNDERVAGEPL